MAFGQKESREPVVSGDPTASAGSSRPSRSLARDHRFGPRGPAGFGGWAGGCACVFAAVWSDRPAAAMGFFVSLSYLWHTIFEKRISHMYEILNEVYLQNLFTDRCNFSR